MVYHGHSRQKIWTWISFICVTFFSAPSLSLSPSPLSLRHLHSLWSARTLTFRPTLFYVQFLSILNWKRHAYFTHTRFGSLLPHGKWLVARMTPNKFVLVFVKCFAFHSNRWKLNHRKNWYLPAWVHIALGAPHTNNYSSYRWSPPQI